VWNLLILTAVFTWLQKTVEEQIRVIQPRRGWTALDFPCGDGWLSALLQETGASVHAFDLFPERSRAKGVRAGFADMAQSIPLADESVDWAFCSEGIEHIPDQLHLLREFNRVLKPGGELLITTPSISHLRARVSGLFLESEYWKRMPPTELDSIWFAESDSENIYYGHLFLLGVHRLQTLASLCGFEVKRRIANRLSNTSLLLAPIWPILALVTLLSYRSYRGKLLHLPPDLVRRVLWRHLRLNLSWQTLFHKHIIWVLRKTDSVANRERELRELFQLGNPLVAPHTPASQK